MNKKIDSGQVALMLMTGLPVNTVAVRLGVSVRQISRIGCVERPKSVSLRKIVDTKHEKEIWRLYVGRGESYRHVARRFGVSHELVRQTLMEDYHGQN